MRSLEPLNRFHQDRPGVEVGGHTPLAIDIAIDPPDLLLGQAEGLAHVGSFLLPNDIPTDEVNYFTVGNRLRKLEGGALPGANIDEIRISDVARDPSDFLFFDEPDPVAVPALPVAGG